MRPSLLCFGLLAGAVGCTRPPAAVAPAVPAPAATVTVVKVEKKPVTRTVELPGSVQPFEETVLYPKVAGQVKAVAADPDKADRPAYDRLIDIGSRVKAGQLLAELSVPELDEEFAQKEAAVKLAEAEVAQAKKSLAASAAGVSAAKAHVTEAKAGLTRAQAVADRWRSDAERVGKLSGGGVLDTAQRDDALTQSKAADAGRDEAAAKVASADAGVTKAEADREKAVADVTAAEAKLGVAKADARRVDALRGHTRLTAPFAGVVTRRAANTGELVPADGKHGLFAVAKTDPVRVVVNVPEADAGLVAEGQAVKLGTPAAGGAGHSGKVVRTAWALEPGSRTLRAEVDLPNPDGLIRPGGFVSAKLTAELPAGWAVPTAAVGKANDEPVVFLAENGKAVRVAVQLHRGDAQFTQVRRYRRPGAADWTDVTGEERVVSPAAGLTDGQAVP